MKHIHEESLYIRQSNFIDQLFDNNSIFFDIETTGFSPAHCTIYLIGCVTKKEDHICIDQFFATTPSEEAEIIQVFLDLLNNYSTIISFNGIGFDIPFIKAKCDFYQLKENFVNYHYLDIFKSVSELKFLLKLSNYKQKTIEDFLGLSREDRYSGGELINIYQEYLNSPSEEKEKLLLLHNYEDIIGMTQLLSILSYLEVFHGQYTITEAKIQPYTDYTKNTQTELFITLQNDFPVPKRVSYQYQEYYLTMKKWTTTLRIPIYSGELYFFYPNYQDYYYLPKEDIAIHKSVASYVDKEYKEKAHASNCYNRKNGEFLPQYENIMNPEFRKTYKDKVSYFEITDDFCTSDIMLRRYVDHILRLMLAHKKI